MTCTRLFYDLAFEVNAFEFAFEGRAVFDLNKTLNALETSQPRLVGTF